MTEAHQAPEPDETPSSPRKPAGQSWETYAEGLIRKAQENGAFDNLPGAGKPLPDLDKPFDPMWWVRNYVKRENLPLAPGQLEVQRRVEKQFEKIFDTASEATARRMVREINAEIGKANARNIAGPASSLTKINEQDIIERWKHHRAQRKRSHP